MKEFSSLVRDRSNSSTSFLLGAQRRNNPQPTGDCRVASLLTRNNAPVRPLPPSPSHKGRGSLTSPRVGFIHGGSAAAGRWQLAMTVNRPIVRASASTVMLDAEDVGLAGIALD